MSLIVVDPGLSTTVQDAGRPGYREWGVPPSGAFDRTSAEVANALLGNPRGSAVLEFTLSGGVYRADCPLAIALAGAPMEAKIRGRNATDRLLQLPLSCSVQEGEQLVLGRAVEGARSYLAVKGGWQTRVVLGSRSREERLRASEILPAEPGSIPTRHPGEPAWRSPAAEPFRVIAGPDCQCDSTMNDSFWAGLRLRVGSRSDRMGLHLDGHAVDVASPPERLSSPVAPGAVQAAGGQLIILGVACGTMGGYPHVAHVISVDLDRLGQLKPGDLVRFQCVTLEEARRLDRDARAQRRALTSRLALVAQAE
jgi:allophanate hydrolase subunit 2